MGQSSSDAEKLGPVRSALKRFVLGGSTDPEPGVLLSKDTLAHDRTVMAAERTLMAWVRTAISLISFGFTIFKFMQTMASAEKLQKFGLGDVRTLGMTMIGIGMVALVIAIIQHIGHMKRLGIHDRKHLYSLSVVFAGAFWLVGALAFVLVATD